MDKDRELKTLLYMSFVCGFSVLGVASLLSTDVSVFLNLSLSQSIQISAGFFAVTYAFSVVPGYISDRILSQKKVINIGVTLLGFGSILPVIFGDRMIVAGIIILGLGFVFSNIKYVVLSGLYPNKNKEHFRAFYLCFVYQLLGSVSGTLTIKYSIDHFPWEFAFTLISVFSFICLCRTLTLKTNEEKRNVSCYRLFPITFFIVIACIIIGSNVIVDDLYLSIFINIIFGFFCIRYTSLILKYKGTVRSNLIKMAAIIFAVIVFYAFLFQVFSTLPQTFANKTNRVIFGLFELSPAWFVPIYQCWVIVVASVLSLTGIGAKYSDTSKIMFGILSGGISFLLFGMMYSSHSNNIHWLFPVIACIPLAIGENFLSPVMSSTVTRLSPHKERGILNGLSQMSMSFSGMLAVKIGCSVIVADQVEANSYIPLSLTLIIPSLLFSSFMSFKMVKNKQDSEYRNLLNYQR